MPSSVGSYYTKKNILTAFGAEPFFVAAGVVATYTLIDGSDGGVLASNLVPIHGGYYRAPDVPSKFP